MMMCVTDFLPLDVRDTNGEVASGLAVVQHAV